MARWLFGDVVTLDAIGSTHRYPEVDDFSMLLKFSSGAHATFASSADASWFFPFERIEVFGYHTTIETQEMERINFTEGLGAKLTTYSFHQLTKEDKWGYRQEDEAFLRSIVEGTPVAVTALDGVKSIELVDACYRAVQTGERIRFQSD
jgi:myo-inositol 2-dehydrogenase/D-chiro-inositol 1-dehydrogenase